jgi:branched-chain amino acid transport system permease protein
MVNGISLGSIYALIALGYTMVYGIIKLINFAHGDIYMIGAYVGFAATTYAHLGFFPALILSMASCSVLGMITEKVAYKPLRHSTKIAVLITAIGVSLLMEYVMMYFVGAEVRSFPKVLPDTKLNFGNVIINVQQIYIVVTAVALMILLQFIVNKTKIGKAMRAVSADPDAAQLMGIKVDTTISFTFAIGSALAGAGGVLV